MRSNKVETGLELHDSHELRLRDDLKDSFGVYSWIDWSQGSANAQAEKLTY